MKQKFKLVAAFLCGAVFFSGISYAATGDLIARPTNFKVVVDGKEQKFNNKVVTIENTTYLSVRDTAQAVGKEVDFKNGVITLSESNVASANDASQSTNNNKLTYEKLPITISKGGFTVAVSSVEYSDISVDFHVTIENTNSDGAHIQYGDPLRVNDNISGIKPEIKGTVRGTKEQNFPEKIEANSIIEGIIRKSKPESTDIQNLSFQIRVGLEDFSFYIDVK